MDVQHVVINISRRSKASQKTIEIPSDKALVRASIELRDLGRQKRVAAGAYGSCIGVYLPPTAYSVGSVDAFTGERGNFTCQGEIRESCAFWCESEARLADTNYETTPPSIHYYCKQINGYQPSLFDSASSQQPEERQEGAPELVNHKRFERNPILRKLCIDRLGVQCKICGTRLSDLYGATGEDLIHVHHLVPLSSIAGAHSVNAVRDLIPVCPNCHAVMHRRNPPYTPEEVKVMIRNSKGNRS